MNRKALVAHLYDGIPGVVKPFGLVEGLTLSGIVPHLRFVVGFEGAQVGLPTLLEVEFSEVKFVRMHPDFVNPEGCGCPT
jgi:hypothetical protein